MSLAEATESIQHSITPGECRDQYYPGKENSFLQCFSSLQDNRFYISLPSLNQGATNTVILNPNQGYSDMVLSVQLPVPTTEGVGSYAGWALPRGWLASMVDTMALRIGGSSLYYFTGDQLMVENLSECESTDKKQAVMNLAGAELGTAGTPLVPATNPALLSASIYLKMPYNSISALQKTLPLPTDLLSQPVQVLITWKRFSDVAFWYGAGEPVLSALPNQFQLAQVNFRQTTIQNSEHLLSRRHNMNVSALTYPLRYFPQTTFRTTVSQSANATSSSNLFPVQVNLTGFRAGSVREIFCWARQVADASGNPVASGNPWNWSPFVNFQLLINGLIMYDARNYNNALWSICDSKTTTQVDNTVLSASAGNASASASASVMPWLKVPFSQLSEPMAYENDLTLGYFIANSVINVYCKLPVAGQYELSFEYRYASSLLFSKGTAEYVF